MDILEKIKTTKTYLNKSKKTSGNKFKIKMTYKNKTIYFIFNDNYLNDSDKKDFLFRRLLKTNNTVATSQKGKDMTVEKINEFKEVKELLKTKKLSIYEMANIQHYFDIVELLKQRLSEEQLTEIDSKKTNIINEYNYLECNIVAEKDDLMCFVILKSLYDINVSKWQIADYLNITSLQEVYTDECIFNDTVEDIKNL